MSIPLPDKIHELLRWQPEAGDVLVIRNTEVQLDRQQSGEVAREVRRALQLPEDFPVIALGYDWEVHVTKLPE